MKKQPIYWLKCYAQVGVVGHTQVSMVNDSPHGDDGVYFNTTNEDRVQTSSVPMIGVDDVISLPKGQAFMIVNGGELYKIRIPLPISCKKQTKTPLQIFSTYFNRTI
ncbi:conjugative coupling factor TraD [Legionella gratiana]|uniref:Conjugative coupling factor TraD n=1 Tax=Legionella gratiana TaxID=45066 RepID=A0A378J6W5_9GAMM|nr:conjugative coupling factor TraD [Legionella gratiana]STX43523.1 conjugative coupling factor TraD [Legionella gratiana]